MSRVIPGRSRRNRRREDVERLLRDFDSSNLAQVDFAHANGISISTLRYWLRRRHDEGHGVDRKPALIPVTLREAFGGSVARIEITLANGRELRLPVDMAAERVASLAAALDS
jgi:hypothetical protein